MKKSTVSIFASSICLALSVNGAFAQDQNATKLNKMVVVSSTTPKSIFEIPASVWYIDEDEIKSDYKQGYSLSNILASRIPALDLSSNGRTNFAQNLRGRDMLVMIDGVSLNSSRRVSRQLDSIDPFNIDHIEVLSGASAVYGTGASGGIVNIITKSATNKELSAETFAGFTSGFNSSEDLDYKIGQAISGGTDKIQGRVGIIYGETKATFDGEGDMVVPDITQGSRQYNDNIDITGTLKIKPADNQQINILAQYYNSEQDMPNGLYFGENLSGIFLGKPELIHSSDGFSSDRQAETTRHMFNIGYNITDILGGQDLYAQASYRKETLNFLPFPQGAYFSASRQETEVSSARLALSKKFNDFTLTYGIDGYIDDFTSNQMIMDPQTSVASGGLVNKKYKIVGRYPDTKVSSLSGYLQGEYELNDRLTLSGGYRHQYIKNEIDDFVTENIQANIALGNGVDADVIKGEDNSYGIDLFNAGITYKIFSNATIWANFSQGFELPDPAKYYGNGVYTQKPDENGHYALLSPYDVKLNGIKTDSFEIGSRYNDGTLNLQGSVYYTLSDKSVNIIQDSKNLRISEDEEDYRVYGLELAGSYWMIDKLQIGASTHLVKSETEVNGDWKKFTILLTSPSKATSFIAWKEKNFGVKLSSKTMFDLKDADKNKIDGYTTFDLASSYNIGGGTLSFGIQNLFDKDYTTVWGQRAQALYGGFVPTSALDYKGRGRTFTLSYNIKY